MNGISRLKYRENTRVATAAQSAIIQLYSLYIKRFVMFLVCNVELLVCLHAVGIYFRVFAYVSLCLLWQALGVKLACCAGVQFDVWLKHTII